MRKIKALAIGLVLGVAGFAYAAGSDGAQTSTQACDTGKTTASCCGQGASCCANGGSACCTAKMAAR